MPRTFTLLKDQALQGVIWHKTRRGTAYVEMHPPYGYHVSGKETRADSAFAISMSRPCAACW